MDNSNSYQRKWLTVLIPLVREIHRILELKESQKEKLFQIQIALFGGAEELKEVSNDWIEDNIFSAKKLNNSSVQLIQLPQHKMELQIHMN